MADRNRPAKTSPTSVPFRELHPAQQATIVAVLVVIVAVVVALCALGGKWGVHAFLDAWATV